MGPRAGLDGCRKSRPLGFFFVFFIKRIFINPIVIYRVRQCTQQRKQVVNTWVYIRCPQVGGCDVQKFRSPDRPGRSESLYRLSYPVLHVRR